MDFCNRNSLFISNSAFKHPSRHITMWESTQLDSNSDSMKHKFLQIDYILSAANQKRILQNVRLYAGTATFSDHRLIKTTIRIDCVLFRCTKRVESKQMNVTNLRDNATRENYRDNLCAELHNINDSTDDKHKNIGTRCPTQ